MFDFDLYFGERQIKRSFVFSSFLAHRLIFECEHFISYNFIKSSIMRSFGVCMHSSTKTEHECQTKSDYGITDYSQSFLPLLLSKECESVNVGGGGGWGYETNSEFTFKWKCSIKHSKIYLCQIVIAHKRFIIIMYTSKVVGKMVQVTGICGLIMLWFGLVIFHHIEYEMDAIAKPNKTIRNMTFPTCIHKCLNEIKNDNDSFARTPSSPALF